MFIDTHAHLDSDKFAHDLPGVLARAAEAGVTTVIAVGCDVASSRRCVELAEAWPNVHATVGIHPCYVSETGGENWQEEIFRLAQHPRVVAIGEIGLDYFHAPPSGTSWEEYKALQAEVFLRQMQMASALGKNIVVHQRNSFADCTEMVAHFSGRLRAQFHCFVNPWTDALPLVEQGHLISFTGIATYPKAPEVLECARQASAGRFMLETDSPYLSPLPVRGRRCEPAHLRHTAEAIARAQGVSLETLARETSAAAREFFGLPTE